MVEGPCQGSLGLVQLVLVEIWCMVQVECRVQQGSLGDKLVQPGRRKVVKIYRLCLWRLTKYMLKSNIQNNVFGVSCDY